MDEVEKQKAIADLDNMFRDEEDGIYKSDDSTSPSSQLYVSTNAANAGAAAADEDALLKHDISPTSCLRGDGVGVDDTSSHVGTIDDNNANRDELNNSITTQELRAAAKKEKRKRYGLYALVGILGVIVVALAISLGVGAKKGQDYASQYSNAFNNAEGGSQGPPPGLLDESSYNGDESGPPSGVLGDSTLEASIVEDIPEEEPGTIVDIAAENEDFSTLVAAVTAAGLLDALSGEGPITVFGMYLHLMACYHVVHI